MSLRVLRAGAHTSIQDGGRPGLLHLGVPPSGAADRDAHALGNRLVGNAAAAASLEATLGGLRLRTDRAAVVAVTGATVGVRAGDRAGAMNAPIHLRPGAVLALAPATAGLRAYVAVRGGIDVPPVLGSRSTDVLTGVGPPVVRDGDVLPLGRPAAPLPGVDVAAVAARVGEPSLRLRLGPREDWLAEHALAALLTRPFTVTPECNRIGIRLQGPSLDWARQAEMPSEPMVAGSLQVPPHGDPILLLFDHPTTGGYPVVGVVDAADLALAGQLRPGQVVRFRPPA